MFEFSVDQRASWGRLALDSDNIFSTPDWAECWWRHYGVGSTPLPLMDRAQDPRVMLPLVRSGRGLRQLRLVGHEQADQLGPVGDRGDWHRAAALVEAARRDGVLGADVLLLQDQLAEHDWWRPLGGVVVRRVAAPTVMVHPGGWEAFLGGRSKNFRSQVKSRERRLIGAAEVRIRVATEETLIPDLTSFWRLHVERWDESAAFAQATSRAFVEDFARVALERGWLRLRLLDVNGVPQAAQLNFRYGDTESCYQQGRNPAFDDRSVGFVLMCDTLRAAHVDALREFRFLRGAESYKYRFANVSQDVTTIAVPLTLRGRLAVAVARRRPQHDELPPVQLPSSLDPVLLADE